ncbi:CPBP family intramembrane glutamic endopeptidase [Amycolatopsis sp. NBC_01286]|uniref:CPBP family intramembrane glutamic endopeptidase n=1 Tax=Amycolatopsis sp. NBC_01286 TaxID=2903560 RepID=UPI002E156B54|nr:CPBP family intramembrane metalloprotease [Amycolatopsis sp. NBC_01286]
MAPLVWLRTRHDATPLTTTLTLYLVLAVVRVAGAYGLPFMVLSLVLTPCVLLVLPRSRWAEAGLRPASNSRLALGLTLVVAVYVAVIAANTAAFGLSRDNWTTGIPTMFRQLASASAAVAAVLMVVAMGLVVPALEEVCYRGALFIAVERIAGTATAITLTSVGWALVHVGNYGLIPFNPAVLAGVLPSVFCMGLALGICRTITGSCVASFVAQGVANLLLVGWLSVVF